MRKYLAIGGPALALCLLGAVRESRADTCATCITLPWTTGECDVGDAGGTCLSVTDTEATDAGVIEGTTSAVLGSGLLGSASSSASGSVGVEGIDSDSTGSGYGVLGVASNPSGTSTYAVGGINAATGTFDVAGNGYGSGVYGQASATGSAGVYGTATGAASAGVYGYDGVESSYGVYGYAAGTGTPWGVYGTAPNSSTGGGVIGESTSAGGFGVAGVAPTSSTAGGIGVFGQGYIGVYGYSSAGDGVYGISSTGYGVAGQAEGYANGIFGYGGGTGVDNATLYAATTATGSSAFAGYFSGSIFVEGTPYCIGCTVFINSSDERLKKDIKPIEGALDLVARLRPVTFEWKDDALARRHGTEQGFIAQDVEKVIPEWVGVGSDGFKTLNLTGLDALTAASLQALDAEDQELKGEVKALTARRRTLMSGFGEGGLGLGIFAVLSALLGSRRKRAADSRSSR